MLVYIPEWRKYFESIWKSPGPTFIKPDQLDPWIKDQMKITLLSTLAPSVTKFCVMRAGQALPHDTKFGNCRDKIVDSRAFLSWALIHGSSWSGLVKVGPGFIIPSYLWPLQNWHDRRRYYSKWKHHIYCNCHLVWFMTSANEASVPFNTIR